MSTEYPKALYLRGWEDLSAYRRVLNAAEEDAARIEGWKTLPEFAHPDGLAAPKPEPVVTVEIPVVNMSPLATETRAPTAPVIPANWRDLPWSEMRLLAVSLGATGRFSKDAAVALIEKSAG